MKIGTKSVLFGVHCPLWHGPTVLYAYYKLYGREAFKLPIIAACFLHDIGYWGCADMDGPEGENHPVPGAFLVSWLFDKCIDIDGFLIKDWKWFFFTVNHSRTYAKRHWAHYSRLAVADKLALSLTPRWFYLLVSSLSGEIKEYMAAEVASGHTNKNTTKKEWYTWGTAKMRDWAYTNKDNGEKA